MRGYNAITALCGLAVLGAMSDSRYRKVPTFRKYDKPIGPVYPATRQQRRAMMRKAGY